MGHELCEDAAADADTAGNDGPGTVGTGRSGYKTERYSDCSAHKTARRYEEGERNEGLFFGKGNNFTEYETSTADGTDAIAA